MPGTPWKFHDWSFSMSCPSGRMTTWSLSASKGTSSTFSVSCLPRRITRTSKVSPGFFSRSMARNSSAVTGCLPPAAMMMSPARRPAFSAGSPSTTRSMRMPESRPRASSTPGSGSDMVMPTITGGWAGWADAPPWPSGMANHRAPRCVPGARGTEPAPGTFMVRMTLPSASRMSTRDPRRWMRSAGTSSPFTLALTRSPSMESSNLVSPSVSITMARDTALSPGWACDVAWPRGWL
jgi:hypothetical protein